MQGRKTFTPKILYSISLQDLVPKNNFYRRLSSLIDFHWIYQQTASYYGSEGQESIDPPFSLKSALWVISTTLQVTAGLLTFVPTALPFVCFLVMI